MRISRSGKRAIAALALLPTLASAQGLPPEAQLPGWAAKSWAAAAAANGIELAAAVNPFYQRGDFDGDGRPDLALLIRDKATGKVGILVLHRAGKPVLLGAGRAFGNGGDDFAWLDQWWVDDGGTKLSRDKDPSGKRRADILRVAKDSSASALIVHRNGKYVWRQQGD